MLLADGHPQCSQSNGCLDTAGPRPGHGPHGPPWRIGWAVARCSEALRALRIRGATASYGAALVNQGDERKASPGPWNPNMTVVLPAFFPAKKKTSWKRKGSSWKHTFSGDGVNVTTLGNYEIIWWRRWWREIQECKYNVVNYFTLSYPNFVGWTGVKRAETIIFICVGRLLRHNVVYRLLPLW